MRAFILNTDPETISGKSKCALWIDVSRGEVMKLLIARFAPRVIDLLEGAHKALSDYVVGNLNAYHTAGHFDFVKHTYSYPTKDERTKNGLVYTRRGDIPFLIFPATEDADLVALAAQFQMSDQEFCETFTENKWLGSTGANYIAPVAEKQISYKPVRDALFAELRSRNILEGF